MMIMIASYFATPKKSRIKIEEHKMKMRRLEILSCFIRCFLTLQITRFRSCFIPFLLQTRKSKTQVSKSEAVNPETRTCFRLLLLIRGNKEAKYKTSLCFLMQFGVLDVFTPIFMKALVVLLVLIGVVCLDLSVTN
ncbi:hypothetical protein LXL04_000317 [Taraxacum kok-saghyz]